MITWIKPDYLDRVSRYNVFLFDFDDTLVDYDQNERLALQALAERIGLSSGNFEQFRKDYRKINVEHWKLYRKGEILAEDIGPSRFRLLGEIYPEIDNPELLSTYYIDSFANNPVPFPQSHELLEYLIRKGKKTFILTNGFTETQKLRISIGGYNRYIHGYLTSQMAGAAKPDPSMVHQALGILGATPDEVLFIGDKVDSDLLAATRAGVDSFHIGEVQEDYGMTDPIGVAYSISNLFEFLSGLGEE